MTHPEEKGRDHLDPSLFFSTAKKYFRNISKNFAQRISPGGFHAIITTGPKMKAMMCINPPAGGFFGGRKKRRLAGGLLVPVRGWQTSEDKFKSKGKELAMDYVKTVLHRCVNCRVHRKDPDRDFRVLWFVDMERRIGWCPGCAGTLAKAKKEYQSNSNSMIVAIPLQAVWSRGK